MVYIPVLYYKFISSTYIVMCSVFSRTSGGHNTLKTGPTTIFGGHVGQRLCNKVRVSTWHRRTTDEERVSSRENRHTKGVPYLDLSDVGEVRVSREDLRLT
jgi:hypothetical protein